MGICFFILLLKGGFQVKQLHDVKSAAGILAVSPWTIRAYIRDGKIQSVRIGRLVRIDEMELERFVNSARADHVAILKPEEEL